MPHWEVGGKKEQGARFTTELGDLQMVGRRLEQRWQRTHTESDRSYYKAHYENYEAVVMAAKKGYFCTIIASASSRSSQLFSASNISETDYSL